MPAGQPTKYLKKYCAEVEKLGKKGQSQISIACSLNVDPATLRLWAKTHAEFSLALARAKAFEQQFWEALGLNNITSKDFNATVWKKSMEARFREEYTTINRSEISGPNGKPIETAVSKTDSWIEEIIEGEAGSSSKESDKR